MMEKNHQKGLAALLSAALLLGCLVGCETTSGQETPPTPDETAAVSALPEEATTPTGDGEASVVVAEPPAQVNTNGATTITLSGKSAEVSGTGASVSGSVVTITKKGTYNISGSLDDGRILVDAKGEEVTLVLNGVDITCSYGSPIYIYKSKLCTIHLNEGTKNTLTDGTAYTFADSYSSQADEEPNACLYSKADLVVQGAGSLTVNGNYNNGITSKDTLLLRDGDITVNAVNHAVNGKDSNTLSSVKLTVTCGGDAVRSTNDKDATLGWVSMTGATLNLTAGEDGVQAETWCSIQGGSYTVTTGGGNAAKLSGDTSAKGIKAGGDLKLLGGTFVMDCADDAFHSNANLTVSGGSYTVSTGDDAFHADETLTVSGGTIDIKTCYEGLEGSDVNITGGDITLVSKDDGVNAAGGADGSGFMDRGGMNKGAFGNGGTSHTMTISGGKLNVIAGGDGMDANGTMILTGGDLTVYSSRGGMGDGPLDSDAGVTLEGGTVFAYGNGMMQAPSAPAQPTVAIGFGQSLPAGGVVTITSGDRTWTYTLAGQANACIFSDPDLKAGNTVTFACDGVTLGEATLDSGLTTIGRVSAGMNVAGGMGDRGDKGNMGGGQGGHAGWRQFGGFGGGPSSDEAPGLPSDQMPDGGQWGGFDRGGMMPGEGGMRGDRAPGAPAETEAPST